MAVTLVHRHPSTLEGDLRDRYEQIRGKYIQWLNQADADYQYTEADEFPGECMVESITVTSLGFETLETWVLTWGTGDDGGPSLLFANFQTVVGDNSLRLTFLGSHFDTASRPLWYLDYPDSREVWV